MNLAVFKSIFQRVLDEEVHEGLAAFETVRDGNITIPRSGILPTPFEPGFQRIGILDSKDIGPDQMNLL